MRFSSSSSYALRNNGALYGRHVSDIIFAGEEQIWFVGDHLNLYQKGVFTFVRDAELKDNVNDALWIDSQLWLATKNNGVARYVNGRLQPVIKVDAGLLDNNIISLKSRGRRLYLLSKYGINSFLVNDPRKVKEIRGIDFFNVTRFDVSENNIILLHRDRLVITDLNGKSLYTYSASTLWNDFLNEMQRDGDILYICGNAGIITYDLQTRDFSVIRAMREGVSDLLVKNSLLYAATETGLYIIDIKKEQFRVLTEEDGLRSSRILKVYPFQTGVLVMTDKGLNYLP
jgi:ligand-binding sensor domain-containing protein